MTNLHAWLLKLLTDEDTNTVNERLPPFDPPMTGLAGVELCRASHADDLERHLRLCSVEPLTLSVMLPRLTDFSLEVLDEKSEYVTLPNGFTMHLVDLRLRAKTSSTWDSVSDEAGHQRFGDAVKAVWTQRTDSDPLNSLVLTAALSWREVAVLRAYAAIVRQILGTFSLSYITDVVAANPPLVVLATDLFAAKHDPRRYGGRACEPRTDEVTRLSELYLASLDEVATLGEDRILRCLHNLLNATVRTNAYRRGPIQETSDHVALKLNATLIPETPSPRPTAEVWVNGPRVLGVHMRFGPVARGGLRWSDRHEDVRTEVLGLAAAQVAKNAVIVPSGAKGGFVPRHLSIAGDDREAINAEAVRAYRTFVGSLLDLTDNRDNNGTVVAPPNVVRHDTDDSYLVVAADKGTATFSDHANAVAIEHGYWLGDAFASGGSKGFDHKAMGITARGAWESVKRHFWELGIDATQAPITVIGIGDMSGDVFGNGLLSTPDLRLLAAFDHRHIFIDPDPDPATSYDERKRLAALPRSTWADYRPTTLSAGGMVYRRDAKFIKLTPQAAKLLDVPTDATPTPDELIRAVLACRADLLWAGGIGTYVKGTKETNDGVGDRANDTIRINGSQLRVAVVAEGGNLGLTLKGRIEASNFGIRVNSDAVDNAAGVTTSDYEVNIKIALAHSGQQRTANERNSLLSSLTEEVADSVLHYNHSQNLRLAMERASASKNAATHQRLVRALEWSPHLAGVEQHLPEAVPTSSAARSLTSPELSQLILAAKIAFKAEVLDSDLPENPWFDTVLHSYFPPALRAVASKGIEQHPLRREIIASQVVSEVIDRAGIASVFSVVEETGLPAPTVITAFLVAIEVFNHRRWTSTVDNLGVGVPVAAQLAVLQEGQRLLERAARWFTSIDRRDGSSLEHLIRRYRETVANLGPNEPDRLTGNEAITFRRNQEAFEAWGLAPSLAAHAARYLDEIVLLDVTELALDHHTDTADVSDLYHQVSELFSIDYLLTRVSMLPRDDRWNASARAALREDLYNALNDLSRSVLIDAQRAGNLRAEPRHRLDAWAALRHELIEAAWGALSEAASSPHPGLAQLSVVVRRLRTLSRAV